MADEDVDRGFLHELLGAPFFQLPGVRAAVAWSPDRQVLAFAALLAGLLFLPFLGAVGLWDPWETHYGEVARSMIQRNDYVHPYWEQAWFFSKPPLTMWLDVIGMLLTGALGGEPFAVARSHTKHLLVLGAIVSIGVAVLAFLRLRRVGPNHWVHPVIGMGALLNAGVLASIASRRSTPTGPTITGAMGELTEWGMRLPFALLSIVAVSLLALAVARLTSQRVGFATAFVLCTMPMYFFLSRQAVTDTPFVTCLISAMACGLIGQLDPVTKHRSAWWYGFYAFTGFACLGKGLLGGLSVAIFLLYIAITALPRDGAGWRRVLDYSVDSLWYFQWVPFVRRRPFFDAPPPLFAQLRTMRFVQGSILFLLIAVPWYLKLSLFDGVDDEGSTFFKRFFIYDHLSRLTSGVHTTTPESTFAYFLEQGGFAVFPWVALVPGALWMAMKGTFDPKTRADHLRLIVTLWALGAFVLVSMSATKFHHYLLPVLPPLAVLMALYVDALWREGVTAHLMSLLVGGALFALVGRDLVNDWQEVIDNRIETQVGLKHLTDLFVYQYERLYPAALVNRDLVFPGGRSLWIGDLVVLVILGLGAYFSMDAFAPKRSRQVGYRTLSLGLVLVGSGLLLSNYTVGRYPPSHMVIVALALTAVFLTWDLIRVRFEGAKQRPWLTNPLVLVALFLLVLGALRAYRYWSRLDITSGTPTWDPLFTMMSRQMNLKMTLGFALGGLGVVCAFAALSRSRLLLFSTFSALALGLGVWINWSHWPDLSHHWTQRDLFWKYYAQREEGEPIVAFLMNWRGETFYSQNRVKQVRENVNVRMAQYAALPGRKWALVEHNRLGILRGAVGSHKVTIVDNVINNKFMLVTIE